MKEKYKYLVETEDIWREVYNQKESKKDQSGLLNISLFLDMEILLIGRFILQGNLKLKMREGEDCIFFCFCLVPEDISRIRTA